MVKDGTADKGMFRCGFYCAQPSERATQIVERCSISATSGSSHGETGIDKAILALTRRCAAFARR